MALTKQQKHEIVAEVSELLSNAKMTVVAQYQGTSVAAMQSLRHNAQDSDTTVKVVKNRLFKQALSTNDKLKSVDTNVLTGQLLYAFNSQDEVAPSQVLANFAKTEPQLTFVGAIAADGTFLSADDVKAMAALPSKQQLRGMLVGTIAAPLSGFMNVLNGNLRGVLNVMQARADSIQ